jgi:hypothetical protein
MSAIQLIEPVDEAPRRAIATTATPADLLRIAVENGADLDRLERLMALQERWQAAEAERAYNAAFSAFKAEAVRIIKNRRVTDGPLKGKGYAELFAVVNAVTPALSAHGLHASWKLTKDERDWLEVTCTLKHVGGHSESVSMGGPPDAGGAKNAIQARASTVSYLERYTLKAITGLSEQEDDSDGNEPTPRGDQAPDDDPLVDAGRAKAMEGTKALTAWWASLKDGDRRRLSAQFGSMKKAAAQADGDAR